MFPSAFCTSLTTVFLFYTVVRSSLHFRYHLSKNVYTISDSFLWSLSFSWSRRVHCYVIISIFNIMSLLWPVTCVCRAWITSRLPSPKKRGATGNTYKYYIFAGCYAWDSTVLIFRLKNCSVTQVSLQFSFHFFETQSPLTKWFVVLRF